LYVFDAHLRIQLLIGDAETGDIVSDKRGLADAEALAEGGRKAAAEQELVRLRDPFAEAKGTWDVGVGLQSATKRIWAGPEGSYRSRT